jgi:D-alanyl-D-alanine carboxypeptidase
MRRMIGPIAALLIACAATSTAAAAPPQIQSEAYVVIDAQTGQILAEKNAHRRMYPASITKILTCALALEEGSASDATTMSYAATHSIGSGTTHIALTEGEVVSVGDLLAATMIESANDAANGLAEYISGSMEDFAQRMNQKAAETGATDSHFVNAHGLHDDSHYTTAGDMAQITRWALTVEGFRELFGAESHTIAPTNKQPKSRTFGTHHHMLVESAYCYEGVTGGKLGWTPQATHTLVTLAGRDGMELICVVMKTTGQYDKYEDTAALLDYCFENYSAAMMSTARYNDLSIPVYDGGAQIAEVLLPTQEIRVNRPATMAKVDIGMELLAPERYEQGDEIAPALRFFDKAGAVIAQLPIDYELRAVGPIETAVLAAHSEKPQSPFFAPWMLIPAAFLLLLALLLLVRARNLRRLRQRKLRRLHRRTRVIRPHSGGISARR